MNDKRMRELAQLAHDEYFEPSPESLRGVEMALWLKVVRAVLAVGCDKQPAVLPPDVARAGTLSEVAAECVRQNAKWGEQNHPNGTGGFYARTALHAKQKTDAQAKAGQLTWLDILYEEVVEAFAEIDPANLRTELIHVAAVATQWVEAVDRQAALALAAEGDALAGDTGETA